MTEAVDELVAETEQDVESVIRVSTSELVAAVTRAKVTVASSEALPVLQNLAVVIRNGVVCFETFNHALGLRQTLATAETSAADQVVLISYRLLSEICSVLKGPDTVFTWGDDQLTVSSRTATWRIRTSLLTWPAVPFGATGTTWDQIDREWFIASLDKVRKAASKDSVRPALQLVDISGSRVRAADGGRLHQVEQDTTSAMRWQVSVVRTQALMRIMATMGGLGVYARTEEGATLVRSEDGTIVITVIGTTLEYPAVDDVILTPAMGNNMTLACGRADLITALESVRVTAGDSSKVVRLRYADEVLVVSSADSRGNTGEVPIQATWSGRSSGHTSAFSCLSLLDLLYSLQEDEVGLRFGPDLSARPSPLYVHEESSGFRGVVAQMRIP